jgi:hypothetical protein
MRTAQEGKLNSEETNLKLMELSKHPKKKIDFYPREYFYRFLSITLGTTAAPGFNYYFFKRVHAHTLY